MVAVRGSTSDSFGAWRTHAIPLTNATQVYVKDPAGLPFVPYWKRMLGFGRTPTLIPGQSAVVTIPILWTDLAMFDDEMRLRLWAGGYAVSAGGASNETPLRANVTLAH
jgi:hypothetical protein